MAADDGAGSIRVTPVEPLITMTPSEPHPQSTRAVVPYAVLTFFGALLLFVVQPMLAKWLLPAVGGSPGTWAACMLLYQVLLLLGYVYADLLSTRLSPRDQGRVHVVVVVLAVLALLLAPRATSPELVALSPSLAIPWLLLQQVGLPFFVLSTTAPLLQRWAAGVSGRSPYSLYALSNAGCLVGLLGYPFLLEPRLGLARQRALWAVAFGIFALGMVWVAARARRAVPRAGSTATAPGPGLGPSSGARARWLSWAFVPSVMLLATTNHITVDVAAVPLLWVVPLVLYLGSFILAFSVWRSAWRGPALALWILSATGIGLNAFAQAEAPLWRQLGASLGALFASALLCHGELARTRPAVGQLTGFYVLIATGGALGGAFVSLVAPLVFSDFYELELGAIATFGMLLAVARQGAASDWGRSERLLLWLGSGLCFPLLAASMLVRGQTASGQDRVLAKSRGFLGSLKVVQLRDGRMLTHGRIQHGFQLSEPALSQSPTLYFGRETALGRVLDERRLGRPRRIGVVGLGVGTIASYGRPGDTLRFYEIDPDVVVIAERHFSFLAASAAQVQVVVGDGRLALQREPDHDFDVLVLDAFSSDSVPVHLLTHEAFGVYARQLAPDGVLLANVSNRYLSIGRVVCGGARSIGMGCALTDTPSDPARHLAHAGWAVLARDPSVLAGLTQGLSVGPPPGSDVVWTDARASILSILR